MVGDVGVLPRHVLEVLAHRGFDLKLSRAEAYIFDLVLELAESRVVEVALGLVAVLVKAFAERLLVLLDFFADGLKLGLFLPVVGLEALVLLEVLFPEQDDLIVLGSSDIGASIKHKKINQVFLNSKAIFDCNTLM